jgi:lipid-binding SYLF domain-containing protein
MKTYCTTIIALALLCVAATFGGCSTAPKSGDQVSFRQESAAAKEWFERNTPGLRKQIDNSAAYIVFPSVGQWGIVFTGGQFGRGMVSRPGGQQEGWGAINTGSLGLQAGVRGFKMLMVIQDEATLNRLKENKLTGSVSGVVVVAETGSSATAAFENGVAVYQGAGSGLMAGVNIGLEYLRFKSIEDDR